MPTASGGSAVEAATLGEARAGATNLGGSAAEATTSRRAGGALELVHGLERALEQIH